MVIWHELKTWPEYFEAALKGVKTFEIRKNDRNFAVGENLLLKEFDPERQEYTGRAELFSIIYITDFPQGLREGYVCMAIEMVP